MRGFLPLALFRRSFIFTTDTYGTIKRVKFPVRTTPEGMANAYSDLKGKDLESNLLFTQEADGYEIPRPKTVA